jgi:hypothetical protein
MLQKAPWRILPFTLFKWVKHCARIRDPQLHREPSPLHLKADIAALRMLALAGKFGLLLRIGTGIAAVIFSGRNRTVASRVFTFL